MGFGWGAFHLFFSISNIKCIIYRLSTSKSIKWIDLATFKAQKLIWTLQGNRVAIIPHVKQKQRTAWCTAKRRGAKGLVLLAMSVKYHFVSVVAGHVTII